MDVIYPIKAQKKLPSGQKVAKRQVFKHKNGGETGRFFPSAICAENGAFSYVSTSNLAHYSTSSYLMRHDENGEDLGKNPPQTGKKRGRFCALILPASSRTLTVSNVPETGCNVNIYQEIQSGNKIH